MPLKQTSLDAGLEIVTARLRLVPISMAYAEDIFATFTPQVTTYMFPASPTAIEETRAFIADSIVRRQRATDLVVVILHGETGEFLGNAGLHDLETEQPVLGIWLKTAVHGNRYGSEVIAGLVAWARENVSFTSIRYPVDRRNIPSRRIPEAYTDVIRAEYKDISAAGIELDLIEYWIQ